MTETPQNSGNNTLMKELLKQNKTKFPKTGDLVDGTVLSRGKNEVLLDIDGITCGIVRGEELIDQSGITDNIKLGDRVTATVLDIENERGLMELSFKAAGHRKAWSRLGELMYAKETIAAIVTDANKGGLVMRVENSVAFLPVSQLTPEHYPRVEGGDKQKILEHLKQFIGQQLSVRIIDMQEKENKLIVSERAAQEEKQKEILNKYAVGNIVEGAVTGVVDFGAFVEFDEGIEGLVHISELAWQRVENPHDIIKTGDHVRAKIIDIAGTRISLSLKALKEDPWSQAQERYRAGQRVLGKILKINPFGYFVELDSDIHGLAHASELDLAPGQSPDAIAKEGDTMEFTVLSLEPKEHRLGLTRKSFAPPAPAAEPPSPDTDEHKNDAEHTKET